MHLIFLVPLKYLVSLIKIQRTLYTVCDFGVVFIGYAEDDNLLVVVKNNC
jgi:hypothetical protein